MEQMEAGAEHPFWVILDPLEHFISGHATLAEAEAEARRLNQWAQAQGRSPHYTTKLRPQIEE
jgi:hypothetical protein